MTPRIHQQIEKFVGPTSGVHAVLFYGPEDQFVRQAAEDLVAAWLCSNLVDGLPCGVCRQCQAYGRGTHADFRTIGPKGPSSQIRVPQITPRKPSKDEEPEQSLQEFFRTPPLIGSRKVVLLTQADRMNGSASNALLKILEEPHPYAKLVLTTTALGDLLPTILSRCAKVPVESDGPVGDSSGEQAVARIAERVGVASPAEVMLLSERLREAALLFEADNARSGQAMALKVLTQYLLKSRPDRPQWAQAAIEVHRRIIGNGSAAISFDALFAELTTL